MLRSGVTAMCLCLTLAAPAAGATNPGQQGALRYLEQQITAENGVLADQQREQENANATLRQTGRAQAIARIGCGPVFAATVENLLASTFGPLGYSGLTAPLSPATCALLTEGVATWIDAQSAVADVSGDLLQQVGTGVQTLTVKANALGAQISSGVAIGSAGASARRAGRTLRVRGAGGSRLRRIRVTFRGRTLHDRAVASASVRIPTTGLRAGAHRVTVTARDHLGRRWRRSHWIYVPVPRR